VSALTHEQVTAALQTLPGWSYEHDKIYRIFTFNNFIQAMHFINSVGHLAERLQHHPHMTVEYNKVLVASTTHDAGNKVTRKDLDLARAIEEIFEE
jgi:4a-hydroxytetrahydrobiopterin dehydratase